MNFTAIQTLDSPCLPLLRSMLSRQKLAWQELDDTWQDKPAVKVVVIGAAPKKARNAPKPRSKPSYSSEALPDGSYLWNGSFKASFPYCPKADARLKREAKARVDKALKAPGVWS